MMWYYLGNPMFSHFGRTQTCDRRCDGHNTTAYTMLAYHHVLETGEVSILPLLFCVIFFV